MLQFNVSFSAFLYLLRNDEDSLRSSTHECLESIDDHGPSAVVVLVRRSFPTRGDGGRNDTERSRESGRGVIWSRTVAPVPPFNRRDRALCPVRKRPSMQEPTMTGPGFCAPRIVVHTPVWRANGRTQRWDEGRSVSTGTGGGPCPGSTIPLSSSFLLSFECLTV